MSFIAPRLESFDYLGEYRYSLTICTLNRRRVFEDREMVRLPRFAKLLKQLSGFTYRHRMGLILWQRSYWDHVLRAEQDTVVVARYILANPVRAGLVGSAEDYPFSGSLTHSRDELFDFLRGART